MTRRFYPGRPTSTVPGRDVGLALRLPAQTPTTTATPDAPAAERVIRVIYDGVDPPEGLLLPQDVTEIYLSDNGTCETRLDHDGATPVGDGEFEAIAVSYCVETALILDGGDQFGTAAACTDTLDITVVCVDGVPTLEVRNGGGDLLGTADLSTLLPPIPLTINGASAGTISPCSTGVEVEVSGTCELEGEVCVGNGSVTVDDGLGGGGSDVFSC